MSKTSKKLLKLLQNVVLLCYNDYTINARVATVIFVNKYLEGMISMKFIIVGRNIEVTPGLRAAVEEKIGKLDKYFNPDTEVHVTLSVEKDRQKIEVTIPVKGSIIRSEQVSNDMYVSIDLVEEIIERQLKKYKNKIVDKQQAVASFSKAYVENDYTDDEEIKIVRTKKFDIKPMYPEDACIQMELLGHSFFVFCNAETDQVNVVYKRKGDTYGLIEPEV
jgi:putative sigma-54 modulation protein